MSLFRALTALLVCLLLFSTATADEGALRQQIADLEKRVYQLEQRLEDSDTRDRWKDPILWQRLKKEMSGRDVEKLLGRPGKIEEQIFTTWYYHPSSKLHSFIWFDEGVVLGWQAPN